MPSSSPIVLLTDFGTRDPYAGILKGVIAGIAPQLPVIDLTHEIEPGDLLQGAVTLWAARSYFPSGSVFCCVVDPGVGTGRQAILLESGGQRFIGPDNGLFSFVMDQDCSAWRLASPKFLSREISLTFHGRDVFAPAAAHAALGVSGNSFGQPAENLVQLMQPYLTLTAGQVLEGEILFSDKFGNLLTSLGVFKMVDSGNYSLNPWIRGVELPELEERFYSRPNTRLALPGGLSLDWVRTFADKPVGEPAFLVGSTGLIEVIANRANAAEMLQLKRGDRITLLQTGDE